MSEGRPRSKAVLVTNFVAFVMVASFVGYTVADYRQWRTGASDAGMNAWGDIKVLCLIVNLVAWLTATALFFLWPPMDWGQRTTGAVVIVSVWLLNGLCLGLFLVGLVAFLFP